MGTEHSAERNPNRAGPVRDERMDLFQRVTPRPLRFHQVHGDNIVLSKDNTIACRIEGFCKGIVFSERPIAINERVYVKLLEVSPNWSGALRIGFTMNNPQFLKSKVPKYACPDLTSMHGNWAKAVGEKLAKKNTILYFYVDESGDVHYGIGSDECGIFFGGVNTTGKLWAVLDIYGNTVAVEFVDPCSNHDSQNNAYNSNSIQPEYSSESQNAINIKSLAFHQVHGEGISLHKYRTVAVKLKDHTSGAYLFTDRPIELGKTILLNVSKVNPSTRSISTPLVYGITSCNPLHIHPNELPDNPEDLMDRLEYWVVRHVSGSYEVGDDLKFTLSSRGEFETLYNEDLEPVIFVDTSQPLWLFIKMNECVMEVRLIGSLSNRNILDEATGDLKDLKVGESSTDGKPGPSGQKPPNECVICYEGAIDCVIYRCGHMCMCHTCALKLFNTSPTPLCPMCRNQIDDIIKIYK